VLILAARYAAGKAGIPYCSTVIWCEIKETVPGRFFTDRIRLMIGYRLACRSDFTITIAAVDWLVTAGLERYFSSFAALTAGSGEHLAGRGAIAPVTVAVASAGAAAGSAGRCFTCLTAVGTALRLVREASLLEMFLLFSGEGKRGAAIGTSEGFVLETHWMASSL